ncbi:Frizzled-9 [Balamuthia mandrillaris]
MQSPLTVVWFGLCALLLCAQGVSSDSCARWSGLPMVCQKFGLKPGQWVFVPEWINGGEFNERLVNGTDDLLAIVIDRTRSAQFLAPDLGVCAGDAMRMVCMSWLRPCLLTEDGQPVIFPQQTCHEVCEDYVEKCFNITNAMGIPPGVGFLKPKNITRALWSCDMPDDGAQNTKFYPEASSLNNNTFVTAPLYSNSTSEPTLVNASNTQCRMGETTKVGAGSICNEPLVANEDGLCVFECPLPSLTEKQYDELDIIQSVFGWLSWAGSMFICLSYFAHPKLRSFPANLILMTAISAHVASLAFILPTFVGTEEVWCDGGTEFLPRMAFKDTSLTGGRLNPSDALAVVFDVDSLLVKGPWCSVQGLLLQFGFLSGTFWWCIVVGNIFSEVYYPHMKDQLHKIKMVAYHGLAWGLPAIFTIIPLAADRIAFPNAASVCFISYEDSNAFQLAFWFIPIGLLLLSGFIFFLASLGRLIPLLLRTTTNDGNKRKLKLVAVYARLLLFVAIQFCLYLFIFCHTIVVESNKEEIGRAYEDYYSCLLFINYPDYPRDSCSLGGSVTNLFPLIVLKGIGFSILGFGLFLNFVTFSSLKFWAQVARAFLTPLTRRGQEGGDEGWPKRVARELRELWRNGSGAGSSASGRSSRRKQRSPKQNTTMVMTITAQEADSEAEL